MFDNFDQFSRLKKHKKNNELCHLARPLLKKLISKVIFPIMGVRKPKVSLGKNRNKVFFLFPAFTALKNSTQLKKN